MVPASPSTGSHSFYGKVGSSGLARSSQTPLFLYSYRNAHWFRFTSHSIILNIQNHSLTCLSPLDNINSISATPPPPIRLRRTHPLHTTLLTHNRASHEPQRRASLLNMEDPHQGHSPLLSRRVPALESEVPCCAEDFRDWADEYGGKELDTEWTSDVVCSFDEECMWDLGIERGFLGLIKG